MAQQLNRQPETTSEMAMACIMSLKAHYSPE
jgi:hypothetical protein